MRNPLLASLPIRRPKRPKVPAQSSARSASPENKENRDPMHQKHQSCFPNSQQEGNSKGFLERAASPSPVSTIGECSDLDKSVLGALPGRVYCEDCHMTVTTTVQLHLPSLPLYELFSWQALCLLGEMGQCCAQESLLRYQEIRHNCRRCGRLLACISPV